MITALLEMCFANVEGGLEVNLDKLSEQDIVKILFAENPGILVQVKDKKAFEKLMEEAGVGFAIIAKPTSERHILVSKEGVQYHFGIDYMRDVWYESSYKLDIKAGVGFAIIAKPTSERHILVSKEGVQYHFGIDYMRDVWYESSYKLDIKQSGSVCAGNRFENYKMQPLEFKYPKSFTGKLSSYGLTADRKGKSGIRAAVIREKGCRFENYKMQPLEFKYPKSFTGKLSSYGLTADRKGKSGIRAAVIREKGCQCERETSYALYLAGFDVKDVHMTDLASGRETLEDVNMIVFCGGFSNSDVLGSAKGWAGGFLFNEKAKKALDNFYARPDTLSLGICNGCQLMAELGVVYPEHEKKHKMLHNDSHKFESNFISVEIPTLSLGICNGCQLMAELGVVYPEHEKKHKMLHNDSHKFESNFISVEIPKNHSVMFGSLSGSKLGIWVAHGEGKFSFPYEEKEYHIALKYNYEGYPANPNGSPWSVAGVCSHDGRHLAMMPHLERAMFPWQCGYYPEDRRNSDEVTPWIEGFVNARKWIEEHKK